MVFKKNSNNNLVFKTSDRILWIFYLILFKNIRFNCYNNKLAKIEISNLNTAIKYHTNLKKYYLFFNSINLDVSYYCYNYNFSNLYSTLLYYLYSLPKSLQLKKVYNSFFYRFKTFLNILNIYIIPNHIYKVIDVFFFKKTKYKLKKTKYLLNVFYSYYKVINFNLNYFLFLTCLTFLNISYAYSYNNIIDYYSFIVENLFYKNFKKYFTIKNIYLFSTSWYSNRRRFVIDLCTLTENINDFYIQKKLMTSYSSVKFVKSLNLSKSYNVSSIIKIIMTQHLRRVLISSNINKFFIFLKNYIKDFKILFLNIKSPLNEIFLNSPDRRKSKIICDIYINYNQNLNLLDYMNRYKIHVENLFFHKDINNWDKFLNNFLNSLSLVSDFYISNANSIFKKILIRYYLDCNIVFIFNKKLFPLKKKRLQSISRRRYKKIVKFAKRRLWIF